MLLHQRANPADHKQKPKEKNQYVCHDLKATKITNLFAQSKFRTLYLEYNLPARERTLTGTRIILAGSKSGVLPTTFF